MVHCLPLTEVAPPARAALIAEAAAIFYETALVKSFSSESEKSAFYARWFGNYLNADPGAFFLALNEAGGVAGYLAGCVHSFSGSAATIRNAIAFFTPAFCAALRDYPSHFHINVAPGLQRQGIGKRLIARFSSLCAEAGSKGIHVATGAASPAVNFYKACGFVPFPLAEFGAGLAVLTRSLSKRT